MPAVRFFLVPKRLVRAHRALPAHSGRMKLSFVAACHHCMRRVLLSPPAPFASIRPARFLPSPPDSRRLRAQRFFAAIRRPSGNTRKPILSPFVFVRYRYRAVSRNFSLPRKTGSDGTCLSRNATPCALPRLRFLCPNIKTVKFAPDSYTSRIRQIKP